MKKNRLQKPLRIQKVNFHVYSGFACEQIITTRHACSSYKPTQVETNLQLEVLCYALRLFHFLTLLEVSLQTNDMAKAYSVCQTYLRQCAIFKSYRHT